MKGISYFFLIIQFNSFKFIISTFRFRLYILSKFFLLLNIFRGTECSILLARSSGVIAHIYELGKEKKMMV